jgi:hypothetical protein
MVTPLEPGLVVDVLLEGGWQRHAAVVDVTPDTVELTPVDGPLALPGALDACAASLEWDHGLVGGELACGRDVLRFTPDRPLCVGGRSAPRVTARVEVALRLPAEGRALARTVNLGAAGMLVAGVALAVGDRVDFTLDLGGATVSGHGVVRRTTPDGEAGIAFADLPAASVRMLDRYVAERRGTAAAA